MTEGLDLHLGVDKTAGFVERALETALREAIRSGRLHAGVDLHGLHAQGYWREPGGDRPAALILGYATPPPHAWSRALEALAEVVQEI